MEQPLRIAYLVSQYPATNHTFVLREVRTLRQAGFEIHVASIRGADRPPAKLTPEELDEYRRTYYVIPAGPVAALRDHLAMLVSNPARYISGLVYALKLQGPASSNLFYFAEAVMVGRWMKRNRVSHAHIHFSSTVGLIARRMFPIGISITIHGPDEFNNAAGFHLADKLAASAFVCAISNFGASQIMRFSNPADWSKIEVSRLGVNPAVFEPRPFRENPGVFQLICVGRLAPAKAQYILIDAVARLVGQGRAVLLRLVGDGPDRAILERHVADSKLGHQVKFEGSLNQDRVRALYRETDIFTLASFAEGIPVVLMEAMAMEIPCVATWITGIPELIRNEVEGLLVAPSDVEGLAQAIARLMDDPSMRRRLGEAGRRRVLEEYDLERNTAKLSEIFRRRLLSGSDR